MDMTLIIKAMNSLGSGTFLGISGDEYSGITWVSEPTFTEEEFDAKLAELQAEYDAQEYARSRAGAYDSIGNQLDQLMKDMRDGTTTHQTACEAVKAKYPKP